MRPFLAELGRARRVERLELEPFTREELDDQVGAILGAPADVELLDSIFERSQGNAFFTEELRRRRRAQELPPTLRDILLTRLDERADPVLAGVLHERVGRFLWASGDSVAALRAYQEATRLVPSTPPSAARARVLAARAVRV